MDLVIQVGSFEQMVDRFKKFFYLSYKAYFFKWKEFLILVRKK